MYFLTLEATELGKPRKSLHCSEWLQEYFTWKVTLRHTWVAARLMLAIAPRWNGALVIFFLLRWGEKETERERRFGGYRAMGH